MAAGLVGLSVAGPLLYRHSGWQHYATEVGELSSFELPDGSLLQLNTHSRVDVRFSSSSREIRLLDGEAMFKVVHDSARPFVVRAQDTLIQALGTQFDVYRNSQGTRVSVTEGAVQVATGNHSRVHSVSDASDRDDERTAKLVAGQEVRVDADGHLFRISKTDTVRVTAWRERRFVFVDNPLPDVAAEYNRYNCWPQIRVEGRTAREMLLTGVVHTTDPASMLLFVKTVKGLTVDSGPDEIMVRSRE